MKVTALGGGIPLGDQGAHHLYEFEEGLRLAIDYGAAQKDGKVFPPPMAQGKIDAMLLSHGHFDHTGMLPRFTKAHPEAPVYGTKVTRRFASMLLRDSLKITREKIAAGQNVDVFFNDQDVWNALSHKRFRLVHRPEWFSPWPGWKIRFRPANHINGAAIIDIVTPNGLRVTHSGDISFSELPTINGPIAQDFKPDILVTEATYGDRDLPPRATERQRLVQRVIEVLKRGGQVLVPVFGIAGPNIGIELANGLAEAGIDTPVYIDGMVRKAADIINRSNHWSENDHPAVFPPNLIKMPDGLAGYRLRCELLSRPSVILSSHGMAEGGRVMEYLPPVLANPRSAVLIPGHQVEGTGGRKLLELERGGRFLIPAFGRRPAQIVTLYCDVERFYLSSHASGPEITDWVIELDPKVVIVNHAPPEGFNGLRRRLIDRGFHDSQILAARNGEEINVDERFARQQV